MTKEKNGVELLFGAGARAFEKAWHAQKDAVAFAGVERRAPALFDEESTSIENLLVAHRGRCAAHGRDASGAERILESTDASGARAAYTFGATIDLLGVEATWPTIGRLARLVRRALGLDLSPIQCAVSVVPPGRPTRRTIPAGPTWLIGLTGGIQITATGGTAFTVARGSGSFVPRGATWRATVNDRASVLGWFTLRVPTNFDVCVKELRQTLPRDPRWRALSSGGRFEGHTEEKLAALAGDFADLLAKRTPQAVLDDYARQLLMSPLRTTTSSKARIAPGGRALEYDAFGGARVLSLGRSLRGPARTILNGDAFSIAHLRQTHAEASAGDLSELVLDLLDRDVIEPILEAPWKPVVASGTDRRP